MKLIPAASIQIQRPLKEVFEAIINPEMMTQYFISKSSGPLEQGKEVIWEWPEFPGMQCVVNNIKIEMYHFISFTWDNDTTVEIGLEEKTDHSVVVRVKEFQKDLSEEHIKWLVQNTEGWANFLAFMKAFLEYGINLRVNAFEYLRKKNGIES